MAEAVWRQINPTGQYRVLVTRELPGDRWLEFLTRAGCRIDLCTASGQLTTEQILTAIGTRCDGVIGQLTETWGEELFAALKNAGGKVYGNYAVGFNNIDLEAATRHGIAVGNTPGVLTETTAEMAVALTFAAARRVPESQQFVRAGQFHGWHPTLFLGELLWRKKLGIIGAGRIGQAYARMMVEGHKMDLVYFSPSAKPDLEEYVADYGRFLQNRAMAPVSCQRAETVEELLARADCVSLHTILDPSTHHLIDARRLALMKKNAILVNTARGPIIDEAALVSHCRANPQFRAALDVFENEPALAPGLAELENVVTAPHIASATAWTRENMAVLAAANLSAILAGQPAWQGPDITSFLGADPPQAAPSILNARQLGLALLGP